MTDLVGIVPVAAGAYIATNLDNFLLLVTLLAQYRNRTSAVFAGYFFCMAILCIGGFWIGAAANSIPVEYVGLLGIVPVGIGVAALIRRTEGAAGDVVTSDSSGRSWAYVFSATFLSQIGNGGDTLATFGVLFADSLPEADTVIAATLAVTSIAIAAIANSALKNDRLSRLIGKYAGRVAPFVLIAVGVYVLANTATDLA